MSDIVKSVGVYATGLVDEGGCFLNFTCLMKGTTFPLSVGNFIQDGVVRRHVQGIKQGEGIAGPLPGVGTTATYECHGRPDIRAGTAGFSLLVEKALVLRVDLCWSPEVAAGTWSEIQGVFETQWDGSIKPAKPPAAPWAAAMVTGAAFQKPRDALQQLQRYAMDLAATMHYALVLQTMFPGLLAGPRGSSRRRT